jgi:hypothetical protein
MKCLWQQFSFVEIFFSSVQTRKKDFWRKLIIELYCIRLAITQINYLSEKVFDEALYVVQMLVD